MILIIKVLSLFDGIACGRVALERAGISVSDYFAYEINKYAIKVALNNYPDIIEMGDVCDADFSQFEGVDLLIGGSPCQGFSSAGKQLNFEDPRSKLFFEFVRALNEAKPKFFFLENVKMRKEWQDIISSYLGVEPIEVNASLVSAQNRVRLFWTNIPNFKLPEDRGILLKDILEDDASFASVAKNYGRDIVRSDIDKSCCLMARDYMKYGKQATTRIDIKTGVYSAAFRGRKLNKGLICGRRINEYGHREDYNKDVPITQCLEVRRTNTDKSNCLTTVQKDNVLTPLEPGRYPDAFGKESGNPLPFRYLTVTECERLQTLPDGYTDCISDTQRYQALGNGWCVDVIVEFFKCLKEQDADA